MSECAYLQSNSNSYGSVRYVRGQLRIDFQSWTSWVTAHRIIPIEGAYRRRVSSQSASV